MDVKKGNSSNFLWWWANTLLIGVLVLSINSKLLCVKFFRPFQASPQKTYECRQNHDLVEQFVTYTLALHKANTPNLLLFYPQCNYKLITFFLLVYLPKMLKTEVTSCSIVDCRSDHAELKAEQTENKNVNICVYSHACLNMQFTHTWILFC